MPPAPDVLDEQIRTALQRTPVRSADTASALAIVRARARRRRVLHRGAALVVSVAAFGLAAALVTQEPAGQAVVTDGTASSTTTTTTTTLEYGLPPLTPLVDAPLPMVPRTELLVRNGHVFTAEISEKGLILALSDPTGATGSTWADPQSMPALTSSASGPSSHDPHPMDYVTGATRPEIARVELVTDATTYSVETFAHDAFPDLRFFLFEAPPGTFVTEPDLDSRMVPRPPVLVAYAADGTVLTDSERIRAEHSEFAREVDRRKGVEDKPAAITDATVGPDDQHIVLTVTNCGSEVRPEWTIDDDTLTITATVKRPYAEGPCLTGDTTEIGIGLDTPLDGRRLIDGRTGEPIPTSP